MVKIENAVATAFEDFEFVIEAFDETRRLQVNEVIGNFIPIAMQRMPEPIETD